ncbi:MAG: hypothetical protein JSW51_07440 [Gemmatimonadota bacterium]|nr:MAG: hypothetical protein JSW51_07440 [Gemmatimonadota bacterium]
MAFVPPTSYVPPPRASLEAQDLAREIEDAVVEFQKRRPQTSDGDIRQALNIVKSRGGIGGLRRGSPAVTIAAAAVGMLVMFALLLFLFIAR